MKRLIFSAAAALAFCLLENPLHAQSSEQITLLQTSDLHAYIFPYDYFRAREADIGLSRVATLVDGVRAEGNPVLLLDAGDTIQGSPLGYYHHRKHAGPPDPPTQ